MQYTIVYSNCYSEHEGTHRHKWELSLFSSSPALITQWSSEETSILTAQMTHLRDGEREDG